ncbi:hypothetical protein COHA_005191 [Chlorella ohadii]|uniref:Actin-related protein 2 n=1 Tax=Chlorella ohadii TaxID=2649997 RepID=A0AAD5DMW9_9CHLO|nr:hypothetical protein COHA_005191 [Chlorella ohadii]
MADRNKVLVVDNGTGFCKAGFAGDTFPRSFPCMVGRPLQEAGSSCFPDEPDPKGVYVGAEAAAHKQRLDITYPVRDVLGVDPSEGGCYIMLTEPPLNPKANRQRMFETMFEKYGFEAAYIQVQAVLTLYSLGALTGLVLDSGDGVTHAVPVVDGYSSPHLTGRLNVAGRHITAYLADLLTRRGYSFNRSADFDTVRQIKERLCFMAFDLEQEIQLARDTTCTTESYTLPDGRTIRIGPERFTAPEALINPSLLGVEAPGMAEMVHNCIQARVLTAAKPLARE